MSSSLLAAPTGSGAQRGREVTPSPPGHPVLLHRGRCCAAPGRSISRHRASGTAGTAPALAPCPPGSVGTLGTSDTEHPLFLFLLQAQTMSPVAPRLRGCHGGVTCKTGPWHWSAVPLPSPVTAWGPSPSPRGGPGCAHSRVARAGCQPPGRDSRAGGQGTGGGQAVRGQLFPRLRGTRGGTTKTPASSMSPHRRLRAGEPAALQLQPALIYDLHCRHRAGVSPGRMSQPPRPPNPAPNPPPQPPSPRARDGMGWRGGAVARTHAEPQTDRATQSRALAPAPGDTNRQRGPAQTDRQTGRQTDRQTHAGGAHGSTTTNTHGDTHTHTHMHTHTRVHPRSRPAPTGTPSTARTGGAQQCQRPPRGSVGHGGQGREARPGPTVPTVPGSPGAR